MDIDDDDLDEEDLLRRDMAREVEEAFADVPYPGDDKLITEPDVYPGIFVLPTFRGKHWREITPAMVRQHEFELSCLSPEAFRFYLPCFLIPILLDDPALDHLWLCTFCNLAPGYRQPHFLNELVNLLDARQKAVILRYVELYVRTEVSSPDPRNQEALAFWRRITEPTEET